MTIRLTYFVSHPIQYQAPLLRRIVAEADLDFKVMFESDFSLRRYSDKGFDTDVEWDVPLTGGYESALLSETNLVEAVEASDAVWLHGWETATFRKILREAERLQKPVLMRGENWAGAMPDGPGPIGWAKRYYLRRIFSRCTAFLAIGSANRRYYEDHGVAPSSIFQMPYAVDNDFFDDLADPAGVPETKRDLGLDPEQPVILFAGKLNRRKKPEVLLQAWRKLTSAPNSAPALVFVGDGEMKSELTSSAGKGVVFTGFRNQSEMPSTYAAADVFVLASEREPWGLAINEAMACGTAVIASDQCGAAFDLIDEDCGRIVPANDPEKLAEAISQVLGDAEQMGAAARKKISNWDFDADITGLRSALDAVL